MSDVSILAIAIGFAVLSWLLIVLSDALMGDQAMNGSELIGLVLSLGLLVYLVDCAVEAGVVRMTSNDWIQLVLYFVVLAALAKPLGWFMARVYEGKPCGLDRALGWLERGIYRVAGIDPQRGNELAQVHRRGAAVQRRRIPGRLCAAAIAGPCCRSIRKSLPANTPDSGVQHRGQLRHEHQLAELRRRDDDELSLADARADGAELRLGRVRHGRAGGA